MPPSLLVGALAQRLLDARDDKHAAETAVEDLLESVLPGWHRKFPRARGWLWSPPHAIDVFESMDSPAAAAALHMAGFVGGVVFHDHGPDRFLSCACARRMP